MKTLLLLRHGKSSWDDPQLEDHDRPLKPRGCRAAKRVGRWLRDSGLKLDLALCSTALRARETWSYAAELLPRFPVTEYLPELYHCAADDFVPILRRTPANVSTLIVIAHNPGLEDLLVKLRGVREAFPTAALARLTCPITTWEEFEADLPCTLQALIRPREFDGG